VLHYLFFDESYPSSEKQTIVMSAWSVEQPRLNRRSEHQDALNSAVLGSMNNLPFEQVQVKLTQLINGHTTLFAPWLCIAMLALIPGCLGASQSL
jgi:hypothetical protein